MDFSEKLSRIRQGRDLDIFLNDEDEFVRASVAEQGYGLDKLIDDENWRVRGAVAQQGYGLDKLVHDKDGRVLLDLFDYFCSDEHMSEWIKAHPDKCVLPENCSDAAESKIDDMKVRLNVLAKNKGLCSDDDYSVDDDVYK